MLASKKKKRHLLDLPPPILVFLSFLTVILSGSFLLMLPFAAEKGQQTRYIDALFVSTSATCVTGLVPFDSGMHWSYFGEIVILLLIQIGGLGFITLASFLMMALGKKQGLKGMMLAQETINHFDSQEALRIIRNLIQIVFSIELIGAALLSFGFMEKHGTMAWYYGIWHAVSAFCNAGFDVLGDNGRSLVMHATNPIVLYTVNLLIIMGGLGFMVWRDVWNYRRTRKLMLHTKIVLTVTGALLFLGSLSIFLLERGNEATLGQFGIIDQINGAVFLSVNCRTAGFASIDLGPMREVTKLINIILMFIGGASGSTAGGIKVNTFGILLLAVVAVVRSSPIILGFKQKIPSATAMKAFAITAMAMVLVGVVTMIISISQPEFQLIDVLYEATSAFGTVGLDTGVTPRLGDLGKMLVVLSMFIGRIGPMTFVISLSMTRRRHSEVIYPEGKVVVG